MYMLAQKCCFSEHVSPLGVFYTDVYTVYICVLYIYNIHILTKKGLKEQRAIDGG